MKAGLSILLFLAAGPGGLSMNQVLAREDRDATAASPDPLATKQEMIRERFKRFEDRVFRLQEQLKEIEPENADRLARVLERTGELNLADRLDAIAGMLGQSSKRFDAVDAQLKWLNDAERVLGILLERDSGNEERKDKIDRLQAYKERLEQLLEQQEALKADSARATLEKRMLQQLNQAISRIDGLYADQEALENEAAGGADTAADQKRLADDVGDLAEDLKRLAEPSSAMDSQRESPQATPDESQNPSDGDSAASEAMAAARKKIAKGAGSAERAKTEMAEAGGQLERGTPSAKASQEAAKEALRDARKQLEQARDALKGEKSGTEMAEEQGALSEKTGALADEIEKEEGGESSSGQAPSGEGSPGEGSPGSDASPPGSEGLSNAAEHMDDAGENLKEDQPADAAADQQEAIDQLQQARKELEEALEQLRQEEKAETLRDLELRFRQMLSKQRVINAQTQTLADLNIAAFERPEQLQLAELSANERALAQDAATCLLILDEDGTTIVFPRILDQISQDMASVADRLADANVGMVTRQVEHEIVDTLEQLLEAIQEMQQENEQGPSGPPSSSPTQKDQLLPESAELRLLRSSQVRVNQRTNVIEESRLAPGESPASLDRECKAAAKRQRDLAGVATQMRERKNQP